jgi:hypothetical protein
VKTAIKELMHLDTIDIIPIGNALYEVSTDDSNIVDFKLDEYNSDKVSMVKYRSYDDSGKRNNAGATLTSSEIKAKE